MAASLVSLISQDLQKKKALSKAWFSLVNKTKKAAQFIIMSCLLYLYSKKKHHHHHQQQEELQATYSNIGELERKPAINKCY